MEKEIRNLEVQNDFSYLTKYSFVMEGIPCKCMESFLQSLKYDNIIVQRLVCDLSAQNARLYGYPFKWGSTKRLYWRGNSFQRNSRAFDELILRAFNELFKNQSFKLALKQISYEELSYLIREVIPLETTILSKQDYLFQFRILYARLWFQKTQKETLFGLLFLFLFYWISEFSDFFV